LFVQLSQPVAVEERRVAGSVTYVLRGAHLRVRNDANPLVTVHFNTPVFRAHLTPQGNDLLFVVEMRSSANPAFRMQTNQDKTATLQVDFGKFDINAANQDPAPPSSDANADARSEPRVRRGPGRPAAKPR
jgi:hypothetical protein